MNPATSNTKTAPTLPGQSRLMVLMFTDAVGSVDLKSRLGNLDYSNLIGRHDEIFKSIIADIQGASIYKDIGDGFLAGFERASDAVIAALRFQRALRDEPWDPEPIRVRAGIHMGQVAQGSLEETGKPKLIGLAADVAARIMGLALPGQVLLSRSVFDDARQFIRRHPPGEPGATSNGTEPSLRWMCHGLYRFKGADEPMEVYEVGADPGSPLKPPPTSEKAARIISGDEELLGWRPGVGLPVPRRAGWTLERRLGEGAVGEAWLAANKTTREKRVFKFCFEAEKAAALKREAKLFRIIRDALGSRPEIARIHEVQLEHPPYFIESDYADLGSLEEWAPARNGLADLTLRQRVEFAARIADAAAAAHSIGVVHKDIKPANILVHAGDDGQPRPRLADFGVACIRDMTQIVERKVSIGGATLQELANPSLTSDAPNYVPPEVLAGRPHEEAGDVYALGVLAFQCIVGDIRRPLTPGWDRQITDSSLREAIALAVDPDERRRLPVAGDFAQRLHTWIKDQPREAVPPSTPITGPLSGASVGLPESTSTPTATAPPTAPATAPSRSADPHDTPTNTLIEHGPTPADDQAVAATLRQHRPDAPKSPASPGAAEADPGSVADVPTDWVFKSSPVAGVPERIGPYRVLKKIGSGGFGLVLEATREDSFQKRVAIKLLQRGAASEETLKRFERERQVMAAMNHPNIARLLEGGKTEDGRPWFAMEFVEGLSIDEYCDRNQLSVRERVNMFVKVCSAMHTVHKAQVVHRDLKPANILVNTKGEPKLLDFGIAKMIEPEWGATPMVTRERRGPLTPQYASPEQVRGEPTTTSADVYCLGVVLYELLTGRLPYRIGGMSDHELEAKVCHTIPPKPSTVVVLEPETSSTGHSPTATGGGGGAGSDTTQLPPSPKRTWARTRTVHSQACMQLADRRGVSPEELRRQLNDDLDDIVMMALRKEPMRRYESAMEMGDDLKRHIERMPVKARPETISYVARRFVGRHRGAVASALAMTVMILAGLVMMTVFWIQAENARKRERASREQTLELLGNFTGAFHSIRRDQAGNLTDKAIAEAAAPILEATKAIPPNDFELRERAVRTLEAIAQAAGGSSLGAGSRHEASRPIVERALEMRRELAAAKPSSLLAKAGLAQCATLAGDLAREMQMTENAQRHYAEAESVTKEFIKDSPECKRMYAIALAKLAGFAAGADKERLLGESIKLRRELADGSAKLEYIIELSNALFALGDARERTDEFDSAIRLHRDALASRLRVYDQARTWETRVDVMRSNVKLARLQSRGESPSKPEKFDDFKEAEARISDAVNFAKQIEIEFGASNLPDKVRQSVMNAYTNGAVLYTKLDKSKEAGANVEDAWRVATAMKAKVKNDITSFMDLADAALSAAGVTEEDNVSVGLLNKSKELFELLTANGATLDKEAAANYQTVLDNIKAFNDAGVKGN